ncbi:MAG: YdeI/OmpD-associated family protein [Fimbriimonadales bacterium]
MGGSVRFDGRIERVGARALIPLPFEPREVWGDRGRYDVCGTIAGATYRGKVEFLEGRAWLPTGPAFLRDTGLLLGQTVSVEVGLEGPNLKDLDPEFRAALESDPAARAAFESLNTFERKNLARSVDEAKRPETRARRIADALERLTQPQGG